MSRPRTFDEDAFMATARDIFWQFGYAGTGIKQICAAAGVHPGSLYGTHSSDKRTLFLQTVRRYLDEVKANGIDIIETAETGEQGIRNYFNNIVDWIESGQRKYGCLGTNSFIEVGERDAEIRTMMSAHFALLEDAFNDALLRDHYPEPRDVSRFLVCVAQGLNVLARTAMGRAELEAIVSTAFMTLESKRPVN